MESTLRLLSILTRSSGQTKLLHQNKKTPIKTPKYLPNALSILENNAFMLSTHPS